MNTLRILRGGREDRWRWTRPHVTVVDLTCPRDRIADTDASGLGTSPELEVLGAVVISDAIDVVHRLARNKVAP